jgi:hypothetical protein
VVIGALSKMRLTTSNRRAWLLRARSARSRRSCSDSAATMSSTNPATDSEPAARAWRSTAGSCDSANAVRIQYAQHGVLPGVVGGVHGLLDPAAERLRGRCRAPQG